MSGGVRLQAGTEYHKQSHSIMFDQIELDLERTFPEHEWFSAVGPLPPP